jgi:hypothetical protein
MRQIFNNGPGSPSAKSISIGPRSITFLKKARVNFKITKDVGIFVSDDGFLSFKFYDPEEAPKGCFRVNLQSIMKTPVIAISTKTLNAIGVKIGQYDLVEKDGYLVSDCKVNSEE